MRYVNVGALDLNGQRFPTKAALKRAVANKTVAFDQTAFPHDGLFPGVIGVNDILKADAVVNVVLSAVGPDPYANRKWYADVVVKRDGELRVA